MLAELEEHGADSAFGMDFVVAVQFPVKIVDKLPGMMNRLRCLGRLPSLVINAPDHRRQLRTKIRRFGHRQPVAQLMQDSTKRSIR